MIKRAGPATEDDGRSGAVEIPKTGGTIVGGLCARTNLTEWLQQGSSSMGTTAGESLPGLAPVGLSGRPRRGRPHVYHRDVRSSVGFVLPSPRK